MDKILPWLVSAGSGAVAGNLVGLVGRLRRLTPLIKTILGALGGVAGGKGLEMAGLLQGLDTVKQAGLGAAVGGLLTYVLGRLMVRKPS